jgi:hypothetical protein
MVGVSAKMVRRYALVTASARSCPPSINPFALG